MILLHLKTFWEESISFTKLPGIHSREKVKTTFIGMFQTETAAPAGSWTEEHKVQRVTESVEHWEGLIGLQLPWDGRCPHSIIYTSSSSSMWILRWWSKAFLPWTVLKMQPGSNSWMSFLQACLFVLLTLGKNKGRGFLGIVAVCGGTSWFWNSNIGKNL